MPNCKLCGDEIVIRSVGGKVTPIHLSGGCPGEPNFRRKSKALTFKHESDYCQPTRCPECKAHVFRIRHKGGSVCVEDLKWPWPKHSCLDPIQDDAPLNTLSETASHLHQANGAVVTRVGFFPGADACLAAIAQPGAGTEFWVVRGIKDPHKLIGALVAISTSDRKLVHPGVAIYDIEEPRWPCVVCGLHFLDSQIEKHMAEKHGYVRCKICLAFIGRNELEAHLDEHKHEAKERQESNATGTDYEHHHGAGQSGQQGFILPRRRSIPSRNCPRGHGPLHVWEGTAQCRACGWPFR